MVASWTANGLKKRLPFGLICFSTRRPMRRITSYNVCYTKLLRDQTLEQVRKLSLDLRPIMLDELGLVPALRSYVKHYAQRVNLEAQFEASGLERRLPSDIETALFRIVQEALTNVARHRITSYNVCYTKLLR